MFRERAFLAALMVLVLAGLPLMPGCSGDDNKTVVSEDTVVFDITGRWNGSWRMGNLTGNLSVTLVQTGGTLSGTITIQDSPCMTTATLTGTVSGDTVAIGAVSASANRYDYTGTIQADGLSINGTWSGNGACASGQGGSFTLTKETSRKTAARRLP